MTNNPINRGTSLSYIIQFKAHNQHDNQSSSTYLECWPPLAVDIYSPLYISSPIALSLPRTLHTHLFHNGTCRRCTDGGEEERRLNCWIQERRVHRDSYTWLKDLCHWGVDAKISPTVQVPGTRYHTPGACTFITWSSGGIRQAIALNLAKCGVYLPHRYVYPYHW